MGSVNYGGPKAPLSPQERRVGPIYTAALEGKHIRFYAPQEGAPRLAWVMFGDLLGLAGVPSSLRKSFIQSFAERVRQHGKAVGTPPVPVVPYWLAREVLMAAKAARWCDRNVPAEFFQEAVMALRAYVRTLPPGERIKYIAEAEAAEHASQTE